MILRADARFIPLGSGTVQTVVTSPPYWGLRDYQLGDKGIGLERTLEEYVAAMVEVFREVRRVLKPDGTVWLNLGDVFYGGNKGNSGPLRPGDKQGTNLGSWSTRRRDTGTLSPTRSGGCPDLKGKDLCMIPARVALALQQPYYAGRIKRVEDRIWLAAMLDGEGCMFIHKRKAGQHNGQGYYRQNDSFGPGLEIANTSERIVERCLELVGQGSICHQDGFGRKQRLYRWNLRTIESRELVRELYPYLVGKHHQARLLYGCPSSGENAEAAHSALIALHRGSQTTVDFPHPPSCFEPGWFVRSDIIWAKKNPMPESVTDRPTRSHEYVFLLSKSQNYFYDQDAIREPISQGTHGRFGANGRRSMGGPKCVDSPNGLIRDAGTMQGITEDHHRNKRDVWTINSEACSEAHFATFPQALVMPCILAGTSAKGECVKCGKNWERVTERSSVKPVDYDGKYKQADPQANGRRMLANLRARRKAGEDHDNPFPSPLTLRWRPTCKCEAPTRPNVVADIFGGSSTTGIVAERLGRRWATLELSAEYISIAKRRTAQRGLFA